MGPGVQEATPLVHNGVMYLPNPSDLVQAIDGATGDLMWEYKRKLPADVTKFLLVPSINRNIAIYGNLIIDTSVDDFVYALDAAHRKAGLGEPHRRLSRGFGAGDLGTDHRQRQDHLGARLRIQGDAQRLRHHGARCEDRQGNLAHPHHSEAGRTRRRDLGRHSGSESPPCGHMDGAQLRSRTEPDLHRDVGDFAGAQVHARR